MDFLRPQRYAHAATSIGTEVGVFHDRYWWHAAGQAEQDFAAAKPQLLEQLNLAFKYIYTSPLHFQLYLIGRSKTLARPTIMIFCEEREARKIAKKALQEILKEALPGFRVGEQAREPGAGRLVIAATQSLASMSGHDQLSDDALEVFLDPVQPIGAIGMSIFVTNRANRVRRATANLVYQGDQCMLLTVSHVFEEDLMIAQGPNNDDSSEYDFGSGTENEDESDDESEIRSEDGSEDLMDSVSDTSLDSEDDSPKVSYSRSTYSTQRTNTSLRTAMATFEPLSPPPSAIDEGSRQTNASSVSSNALIKQRRLLGHRLRYSIDQDWALIKVTDERYLLELQRNFPRAQTSPATLKYCAAEEQSVDYVATIARTSHGTISGESCGEPTYMRLPGSATFQETCRVECDESLEVGDCGVGVFNAHTGAILGHVVATSSTRRIAYLMPATVVCEATQTLYSTSQSSETDAGEATPTDGPTTDFPEPELHGMEQQFDAAVLAMQPLCTGIDDVIEYMDSHMTTVTFRGEEQTFLPRPNFDLVTSEAVIRSCVSRDGNLCLGHQEQNDFVHKICTEGRKMFATCVYGELPLTCVKTLFESGLTDAKFPFREEDCPLQKYKRRFKACFLENQKLFNSAYLDLNSEQEWDGRVAKPVGLDERRSSLLGQGAFGDVYKIWIHPDQRSFSSGADKHGFFAMKVTQHEGTREVSFHRAMADLSHDHLLKCLASFTFSSQYYMVYEKADCDVEKLMAMNNDPRKLVDLRPGDLAQQLFGLADALNLIHNQGQTDCKRTSNLLAPRHAVQKTGYVHDIKPENLLVFVFEDDNRKKKYWFRLSDFSCAKVVDVLSSVAGKNRHSYRTVSKSGTPSYRAPEATATGKTSRPYDVWSLGCVYLELLVWFLDGYAALKDFRDRRECQVTPGGREDEGFYYMPAGSDRFKLRDLVVEMIVSVSRRCEGPLKDIAQLLPQLFEIDPRKRLTAQQLVRKLKHIDSGAEPPIRVTHKPVHSKGLCSRLALADLSISDIELESEPDSTFDGMIRFR
ncbi:hypothetical protein E8E11_001850 [Didymella keratinophila]|nr:hypothetical protein E8E11_001850 [Didymella keratinophila]